MSAYLLYLSGNQNVGLIPSNLDYFNDHFIGEPMTKLWDPPPFEIDNTDGKLADFISWMNQSPVISANAKSVLEQSCAGHVELLPLTKIRGIQYFAVNVTTLIECIDFQRSKTEYSPVVPDKILAVDEFVLKPFEQLPPVFKDCRYRSVVFVDEQFARLARDANLTGVRFLEPSTSRWKAVLGLA